MSGVTLYRTDPARNMWRYYCLDIQRDLFGAWCFIREWGRDGQAGQTRTVPYPTQDAAELAFERQRRAKERKGYIAARAAALSSCCINVPKNSQGQSR
jgi:predicted DNA-binding WGR domain protein